MHVSVFAQIVVYFRTFQTPICEQTPEQSNGDSNKRQKRRWVNLPTMQWSEAPNQKRTQAKNKADSGWVFAVSLFPSPHEAAV